MKINKMIISFLMSTVLFSSIAPTINAEQAVKEPNYVIIDGVKINKNPDLPRNPDADNRFGASKIVKTAIKVIIKQL